MTGTSSIRGKESSDTQLQGSQEIQKKGNYFSRKVDWVKNNPIKTAVIVGTLLALGGALLAIHFTGGFAHFAAWSKNTALPTVGKFMTHPVTLKSWEVGLLATGPLSLAVTSYVVLKKLGIIDSKKQDPIDQDLNEDVDIN